MIQTNENIMGYFAVNDPSMITSYSTESERKKLSSSHHGKKIRYAKGINSHKLLEEWLIKQTKHWYKVSDLSENERIYYYATDEQALEKANSIGSKVELVKTPDQKSNEQAQKKYVTYTINKQKVQEEIIKFNGQESTEITHDDIDYYINENLDIMKNFVDTLKETRDLLCEKHSVVDKKIVDIEHAMEFNKFDAAKGYKIYKLMHDNLNERRMIKDNIKKIEMIINSHLGDNLQIVNKNIDKHFKRSYKPRVLKELFD